MFVSVFTQTFLLKNETKQQNTTYATR